MDGASPNSLQMAAVGGLAANRTEYHKTMNLRRSPGGVFTVHKKSPALGTRGCGGDGGFALGATTVHTEIPKQGDSWAGRMGLTQKIAPARPKSRGWAVTPHIPME